MVKKALSVFLCIVMCLSVFNTALVSVSAVGNAASIFGVKGEAIKGDTLVYTVSVTKEQKNIAGIILNIEFDSTVLKVESCTPAKTKTDAGNAVENFSGTFVHGVTEDNPNLYAVAYTNDVSVSTDKALSFFEIKFKVIDEKRPSTDIKFYCKEYFSLTEPDKNINQEDEPQLIEAFEDISTLAKPVVKAVVPCTDGLKVSWEPVEGAVGYEIKRSSPTSTWETVATVGAAETQFSDTSLISGTTYTYTIRAFNDYGLSLYDAIGVSCQYVEKPVITSLENAVGGIEITWGEAKGAEFYLILRREAGAEKWTQIAKRSKSAGTVYKDTSVTDGKTYEYDVNSATDTFESTSSDVGNSITFVDAPSITAVINTLSGIKLEWSAHKNATHYIIYRKAVGYDAQLLEYAESSTTSFTDKNVVAGKSYIYSVKACTNYGTSAFNPTGVSATRVPSTEVTALVPQKNGIEVSWNAVDGVTGYAIYRKASTGNDWTKVAVVRSDVSSYIDTTLTSGAEYCYAVCPLITVSEGAKIQSDAVYFIKSPMGITLQNLREGIEIKWGASTGAMSYKVLRVSSDGSYEELATVSAQDGTSYLDTDVVLGGKYTYAIKAVSHKGESLISDNSIEYLRIGAIGKTTAVIAVGGIMVTWEVAPEADSYAVFRNTDGEWEQIATVPAAVYIDSDVVSAQSYSYAVAAIIGESRGIVNTDDPQVIKYIAPPANVTATNGGNYTKVNWSAVEGAFSYYIYKVENVENARPTLVTNVSADTLSYTDKAVESGKNYIYYIRTNDGEKLSAESKQVKNMFLGIPTIKSISRAYNGVSFSWNAVEGAEQYRLYRKVSGDSGWTYIKTVGADTLSYTDSGAVNGKRMYYTVRAQSETGIGTYKAASIIYVEAAQLTTSNTANAIQLKWTENPIADNYRIYRKVSTAKSWELLAKDVTGTTYTDKTAKAGVTYRYTIRTNYGGVYSSYKENGWAVRRLTIPALKTAKNGNGCISVTWNKVAGATGYRVYRKVNDDSSWTYLGNVSSTSYLDKDVKNLSTYKYTVRAYYGTSVSSYKSSGISVKYLLTPKATSIANKNGYIELQWNKVSGAASYYVYRKAGSEKSWTKVATVTKNSYTDKNVKSGTNYRYTIRAYGSKTQSGFNSTGWAIKYLATPTLVSATSTTTGIVVKWKPVTGATQYGIYRKTNGGLWELVTKVNGNRTVSYKDKTAEMGIKYTYTVRAHNGNYKSWFNEGITVVDKY